LREHQNQAFSEWRIIRTEQLRSVVGKPTFRDLWEMAAFSGLDSSSPISFTPKDLASLIVPKIPYLLGQ